MGRWIRRGRQQRGQEQQLQRGQWRARRALRLAAVGPLAVGIVWTAAQASSGTEDCTVEVAEGAGQAGIEAALDAVGGGCLDWTVELTGTFDLTDTLVWDTPVPLTLQGPEEPADGMATLRALPIAPATKATHRILTVETPSEVLITLQRLILTGGDVSRGDAAGVDEGGAILADRVRLVDSELKGNAAAVGGAVSALRVTAVRTSFVDNEAEFGVGLGGAINAYLAVDLENVTLRGNAAKFGGAVHLDAADTEGARFDSTFVTFLDNEASDASGGADLHLGDDVFTGGERMPVSLRGALLGGTGGDSNGPACGGSVFTTFPATGIVATATLVPDESCGAPAGSIIARPSDGAVQFRTGTTDLFVPTGDWAGLDAVTCDGTWPAFDQRGISRPQGTACDVGAVEREVVEAPEEDPADDNPPAEDTGSGDSEGTPPETPVAGPVPSSVPAGGGGCADGCP